MRLGALVVSAILISVSCGADEGKPEPEGDGLYPDVVEVVVHEAADGSFTFDVTLSSPYDSPDRYADAWRVRSADGIVFAVRELLHDHGGEQPFTRSLRGVEIPSDVVSVVVEGRDLANGWGGGTATVALP